MIVSRNQTHAPFTLWIGENLRSCGLLFSKKHI